MELSVNGLTVKLPLDVLKAIVREVVTEVVGEIGTDTQLAFDEATAAKMIGVPRHSLRELRTLGRINPVKVGKRYLYSRAMLSRLVGG